MRVNFIKTNENAIAPSRGSAAAAGYDLYANLIEEIKILPQTSVTIGTGLAFELPENTFGAIFARSGLASKQGLRPANCVGVVDSDYRGEVKVALYNDSDFVRTITPNERIAQLVVMPFISMDLIETDSLSTSERGEGGFGSTGSH